MSAETIHLWGFTDQESRREISAAVHAGSVEEVSREVMAHVASHGHAVDWHGRTWTLDGHLTGIECEVPTGDDTTMWHAFVDPREPWPRRVTT